jgi:hypothetical protein
MNAAFVLNRFTKITGQQPICVKPESFYTYEFKEDGERKCKMFTKIINNEFGFDAKGESACTWHCFSEFKFRMHIHGFKLIITLKGVN